MSKLRRSVPNASGKHGAGVAVGGGVRDADTVAVSGGVSEAGGVVAGVADSGGLPLGSGVADAGFVALRVRVGVGVPVTGSETVAVPVGAITDTFRTSDAETVPSELTAWKATVWRPSPMPYDAGTKSNESGPGGNERNGAEREEVEPSMRTRNLRESLAFEDETDPFKGIGVR
jgi:hypothetical protein